MSELTQERVKELFDYDSENGWLIRKKGERGRVVNRPCGHNPNRAGRGCVRIDGKLHLTHRAIWFWHYGEWPNGEIDHIDRNPMNNRIENLRDVSRSENSQNHRLHSNNATGYPGVSWHKSSKKYRGQVAIDNKRISLGYFNTPEEAFLAYQLAKIEYHPTSPISQEYYKELTLAG